MAKRRTRKQKETAKHQFTQQSITNVGFQLSRQKLDKLASPGNDVKGQFIKGSKLAKFQKTKKESARNTAKHDNLSSIRRDIGRSLFLASLTLSLEVMIYFILI